MGCESAQSLTTGPVKGVGIDTYRCIIDTCVSIIVRLTNATYAILHGFSWDGMGIPENPQIRFFSGKRAKIPKNELSQIVNMYEIEGFSVLFSDLVNFKTSRPTLLSISWIRQRLPLNIIASFWTLLTILV